MQHSDPRRSQEYHLLIVPHPCPPALPPQGRNFTPKVTLAGTFRVLENKGLNPQPQIVVSLRIYLSFTAPCGTQVSSYNCTPAQLLPLPCPASPLPYKHGFHIPYPTSLLNANFCLSLLPREPDLMTDFNCLYPIPTPATLSIL